MKLTLCALIAGLAIGSAVAADIPKNPCNKPVVPNRMESDSTVKSFTKHMETYKKCISDFVAERREFSEHSTDKAAAAEAHNAAEAAIVEFNNFAKEVNERNDVEQEKNIKKF